MQASFTCNSSGESNSSNTPLEQRVAVYSFRWAEGILKLAKQAHPRAWEIWGPFLGLSDRQLTFLLASKAPEWPVLRSMAQTLDKWLVKQGTCGQVSGKTIAILLSTLVKSHCKIEQKALKAYLTARLSQTSIEEQVKEAEGAPLAPSNLSNVDARGRRWKQASLF